MYYYYSLFIDHGILDNTWFESPQANNPNYCHTHT